MWFILFVSFLRVSSNYQIVKAKIPLSIQRNGAQKPRAYTVTGSCLTIRILPINIHNRQMEKVSCKEIHLDHTTLLFANISLGSIDLMEENGFMLVKTRSRRDSTQTMTDVDYADNISHLANTPAQVLLLNRDGQRVA